MKTSITLRPLLSAMVLSLTACGGGGDSAPAQHTAYLVKALVSDGSITAAHTDTNLVNPWGIAFEPTGDVWVANNGTQTSTLYDGNGVTTPPVVAIPQNAAAAAAAPTGIVFNGSSSDFIVTGTATAAQFIFDGEGGTLSAWASGTNATRVYDDGAGGAVYKGLAIANNGTANFLYATDFHNNKIDVFDHNFAKFTPAGSFTDPAVPAGYAPFGIQAVQNKVVVTYAQKSPGTNNEVDGIGLGQVAVFDANGNLIKHLISGGALNAPWGIALAPANFGDFSNTLLIGNFGNGVINTYNATTGDFIGPLRAANGAAIVIPGLWGIGFGNGFASQPANALFFAAGINAEAGGEYGRIEAAGVISGTTMCGAYGC